MKPLDSNIHCPSCQAALKPRILVCESCDVKVEGNFHFNEFATLGADDLHFLRIFVQCEGKVREMESALGLSYPTIRSRISELKNKILTPNSETVVPEEDEVKSVLEKLAQKKIDFEEAMKAIRKIRAQAKGKKHEHGN
jgi:hypothetical protein